MENTCYTCTKELISFHSNRKKTNKPNQKEHKNESKFSGKKSHKAFKHEKTQPLAYFLKCKFQPDAQCDRRAGGLSGRGRSFARLMGA